MVQQEWSSHVDKLDSAALADAARRLGYQARVMDAGIKPVWHGTRLVGPAYTLRLIPGQSGCSQAIRSASVGDVLVIDARGRTDAIVWGELLSGAAAEAGLSGAVVDGAVRDVQGVRQLRFPLFARAVAPGTVRWSGTAEMQVGVTVGRVRVYPGDIVFGDELGIVVLAQKVWETVAQAAEQIQRSEEQRLAEYIVAQRGAGSPTTQKPEEV